VVLPQLAIAREAIAAGVQSTSQQTVTVFSNSGTAVYSGKVDIPDGTASAADSVLRMISGATPDPTEILSRVRETLVRYSSRKGAKATFDMTLQIIEAWLGPVSERHERIQALPVERRSWFEPADALNPARVIYSYSVKGVEKVRVVEPSLEEVNAAPDREADREEPAWRSEGDGESTVATTISRLARPVADDTMDYIMQEWEDGIVAAAALSYELEMLQADAAQFDLDWEEFCGDPEDEEGPCYEPILATAYQDEQAPAISGDDGDHAAYARALACRGEKLTRDGWILGALTTVGLLVVSIAAAPATVAAAAGVGILALAGAGEVYFAVEAHDILQECRHEIIE
jgi:hypothetical protein